MKELKSQMLTYSFHRRKPTSCLHVGVVYLGSPENCAKGELMKSHGPALQVYILQVKGKASIGRQ